MSYFQTNYQHPLEEKYFMVAKIFWRFIKTNVMFFKY